MESGSVIFTCSNPVKCSLKMRISELIEEKKNTIFLPRNVGNFCWLLSSFIHTSFCSILFICCVFWCFPFSKYCLNGYQKCSRFLYSRVTYSELDLFSPGKKRIYLLLIQAFCPTIFKLHIVITVNRLNTLFHHVSSMFISETNW